MSKNLDGVVRSLLIKYLTVRNSNEYKGTLKEYCLEYYPNIYKRIKEEYGGKNEN